MAIQIGVGNISNYHFLAVLHNPFEEILGGRSFRKGLRFLSGAGRAPRRGPRCRKV
jgi:hypothetical protein